MAKERERLDALYRVPATDVKARGWRGMVMTVRERGPVLVTNHNQPEAVIIAAADYEALVDSASRAKAIPETALEELRREFDERLAPLRAPDANERLRAAMRGRIQLHGRVKAGIDY
jgi:prevent-host-death family protein